MTALLQLEGVHGSAGSHLLVRLGISLHLLHLSLDLGLRLRLVHALADQDVHEQDLLLARRDGRVLLHLRIALALQLQLVVLRQSSSYLLRRLLSKGAVSIMWILFGYLSMSL